MEKIELTNGFAITMHHHGNTPYIDVSMTRTTGDTISQVTGSLHGAKNLQKLKEALSKLIGRKPMGADGVKMRAMGDTIAKEVPGMAYLLFVGEFGAHKLMNYVANVDRESAIKCLRETADRLEARKGFPTPENN